MTQEREIQVHSQRLLRVLSEMREDVAKLDAEFFERLGQLRVKIVSKLDGIEHQQRARVTQLTKKLDRLDQILSQLDNAADGFIISTKKQLDRQEKRFLKERDDLLKSIPNSAPPEEKVGLEKAKTLAIFDAILFAIDNWSTDGQTSSDVILACQSVLFPVVYERVMKGNSDYYIEEVPVVAPEIVKRGRELVKYIRDNSSTALVDLATWEQHACIVQQWWTNDALPLIYGARDPDWDDDSTLSLGAMEEWRDMPASRALHFPLIFDGMELVEHFRDEIRETTGLPDFTRSTLTTRLDP
jgi:hypothetical protein